MNKTEIETVVRVIDGIPIGDQIYYALYIKLLSFGDDAGSTYCIVYGHTNVWWPPKEVMSTLHSEVLNKGIWCGVIKIDVVLNKCNELNIETPEDFGMPVTPLAAWLVNATKPEFGFELATKELNK